MYIRLDIKISIKNIPSLSEGSGYMNMVGACLPIVICIMKLVSRIDRKYFRIFCFVFYLGRQLLVKRFTVIN